LNTSTDGAGTQHFERRCQRRALLVVGQRARPLEHPNVVLSIDRHAADLAEDPVVRQRLRPKRIDTEGGTLRLHRAGGAKQREYGRQRGRNPTHPNHRHPPLSRTSRRVLATMAHGYDHGKNLDANKSLRGYFRGNIRGQREPKRFAENTS
jgi:hypothetical protein